MLEALRADVRQHHENIAAGRERREFDPVAKLADILRRAGRETGADGGGPLTEKE